MYYTVKVELSQAFFKILDRQFRTLVYDPKVELNPNFGSIKSLRTKL